jgi:hypothetical protein
MRRTQQPIDVDIGIQARGMFAKHLRCANGERRIEKNRRGRHLAAVHQVDEIDDQFLRALDCECWNEQRTVGGVGLANLRGQALAPCLGGGRGAVDIAVGRLRNNIVEPARRLGIGFEQLGIGTEIARGENPQRLTGNALAGKLDLDRRRTEQVTGVPVARANARHGRKPCLVVDRLESVERAKRVGLGVDRSDFRSPARSVAPIKGLSINKVVNWHFGAVRIFAVAQSCSSSRRGTSGGRG